MKSQISFTTDIFESADNASGDAGRDFGEDLARWFVEASSGGEFTFGTPTREDWGWTVPAEAKGEKFTIGFGIMKESVGDGQADWLITVEKTRSWMFGSKDSDMRGELCDLIQNVLRDKPHIREIRWTDQVGHFARKNLA